MDEESAEPKKLSRRKIVLSRVKRRLFKHIWLVRAGLLASVILGLYLIFLFLGFILGKLGITNYGQVITGFIFTPQQRILSINKRTNILLLGKAGAGHDAPDLTDTIIFVSVGYDPPSLVLVSLPRDIWIGQLRAKLNSAYYWGNQREEGGGLTLAKSSVEEVVGVPVHYGVSLDFTGFRQLIDILGEIEVDIERGFEDARYPILGREDDECDGDPEFKCRYETIRFEKGRQLMDGTTALKFVRSRNAQGDEGTDLARAERQQKVLVAIRQKLLSPSSLFSPRKILGIFKVAQKYLETDIDIEAGSILARRMLQSRKGMKTYVIPEEFLVNPPESPRYDNLYVFIPKEGDWSEVQEWVEKVLP